MMDDEQRWQAVMQRDHNHDGRFVYAVRSTGIFCRPTCPSRRPLRENVSFYSSSEAAAQAGYRACQRCRPEAKQPDQQLALVEAVCRYLEAADERPTLEQLGAHFAISPTHLQRVFTQRIGISPRQYADSLRRKRLRAELQQGETVTSALYGAGYGSSSSFYQQAQDALGMAPSAYRQGGAAQLISYAVAPCRLGTLLVAGTEGGLCSISLGDDEEVLVEELRGTFPAAQLREDDGALGVWVEQIVAYLEGTRRQLELPLDIQATAFQRQVWEALQAIPYGETRSYQQVAQQIGRPSATRAVAQACGSNPVALAIPCHRVVRASGELGGYRWGIERKRALLAQESGT